MSLTPPTLIETNKLKTHPSNPRAIRKEKLEKLKKSITEDPEFMEHRALLVNPQMEVFAGNQRLRACIALGWDKVPCYVLDWDEDKQRRAMIKDNVSSGEWDWDILANEWDAAQLEELGMDVPVVHDEPADRDMSSDIAELYRVEVICTSEEEQEAAYNQITNLGYECRLLTL